MPEGSSSNVGMAQVELLEEKTKDSFLIRTLDDVFVEWLKEKKVEGEITVVKIDVEGMELDVLKGSSMILKKYKPHIFVEAATREHFLELSNYLEKLGYISLCNWAETPVYHFAFSPSIFLKTKIYLYKLKYFLKLLYWRLSAIF